MFRWNVSTHTYTVWDDREEKYVAIVNKALPVLQYLDGYKWVTVPTVEIETK